MTKLELNTILKMDPKSAYKLVANLERFSQFISGVRRDNVQQTSPNKRISKWSINTDGINIAWVEEEFLDATNGRIKFQMLEGPFKHYQGYWKISSFKRDMAHLTFSVNIEWGQLLDSGELESDLDRRARLAVRWMFRKLRLECGPVSIIQHEHVKPSTDQSTISEFVTYQNLRGKKIVGVYDHLKGAGTEQPLIILPPGYGETKRDALTMSYHLVQNKFRVLRYDATDHIGESEGDIFHTTLAKMKDDLIATLNFAERQFGDHSCGVISGSLAKRIAVRAAVEDSRIQLLISLVGIVDLQATLKAVYYKDIIGAFLQGNGWDTADILGFEVSREFPETAIREKYHNLSTTLEEVRKLKIPLVFLVAEKDTWVKLEDIKLLSETAGHQPHELYIIPNAMHRIYENPKSARWALNQITASCEKYLRGRIVKPQDTEEPNVRDIATQNKIEKNRLRALRNISREDEQIFWGKYLNKYVLITKCHDFRNLLSLADIMLGPPREGERILDAGCGNSHYGAWLLWSTSARLLEVQQNGIHSRGGPLRNYVGLDFTPPAILQAPKRLAAIQSEVEARSKKSTGIQFSFILSDLNEALPFQSGLFEKICCNLVISYVKNPRFTVRELLRVLKPGGRIVVTSLKPHSDLSQIYRNFVVQSESEKDIEEARKMLSNAGIIQQKEHEGQYHFFSESGLRTLLASAGGSDVKSFLTFGGQAYLAAATKK